MITFPSNIPADLLAYLAFLVGQLVFLLKRAGSAIRNPNTKITSRRQYLYQNWDTWSIRALIEFPFFYGFRHYSLGQLTALVGWSVPSWLVIPDNPIPCFFLGYAADSLLDWAAMSPRLPSYLKSWIGENVPKFDIPVKLQENLDKAQVASQQASELAIKAADAVAVVKEQIPVVNPEAPKNE
jgi:hypothetical protein